MSKTRDFCLLCDKPILKEEGGWAHLVSDKALRIFLCPASSNQFGHIPRAGAVKVRDEERA